MGQKIRDSFLHLAFPTRCVNCATLLPPETLVLCANCASFLDLIRPEERCSLCFDHLEDEDHEICQKCLHYPSQYVHTAAAFDYEGPAGSLIRQLKYGQQPFLAKGMAAFLVAQLDRLDWPLPDALVPVPLTFTHLLERGYNQSELIAREMGRLLNRPVWNILKRRMGDFSQAALNLEQRKSLEEKRFRIKSRIKFRIKSSYALEGKTLLVIDDVMTSGLTLQRCAEALMEGFPAALYALTFCRA